MGSVHHIPESSREEDRDDLAALYPKRNGRSFSEQVHDARYEADAKAMRKARESSNHAVPTEVRYTRAKIAEVANDKDYQDEPIQGTLF